MQFKTLSSEKHCRQAGCVACRVYQVFRLFYPAIRKIDLCAVDPKDLRNHQSPPLLHRLNRTIVDWNGNLFATKPRCRASRRNWQTHLSKVAERYTLQYSYSSVRRPNRQAFHKW